MGLSLVTAPILEPITLTEAKAHLRVDGTDSDVIIAAYITAARQHFEAVTRRALVAQTWDYTLECFPHGDIDLPIQPVISVTSVSYITPAGATASYSAGSSPDVPYYDVTTDGPRAEVFPKYGNVWPETRYHGNAVTVRFVAGYALTTDSPQVVTVPEDIKTCIKLMVGDLFENRETGSTMRIQELPTTRALLSPYILRGF